MGDKTIADIGQEAWHAAADAIRDEVIETCIAVVAQGVQWKPEENFSDNWRKAARQTSFHLAEALRSLKRLDKTESDNGGCQAKSSAQGETVSAPAEPLQATDGGDAYAASLIESLIRRDAWITNERLEAIAQNSEDAEDICSLLKPNTALAILSARAFLLNRHVSQIEEPANAGDEVSQHKKALPDTPSLKEQGEQGDV